MGTDLQELLEEGVRVGKESVEALRSLAEQHHLAPALAQVLEELSLVFPSPEDAIGWLARPTPAFDGSPFDVIAQGEAVRVARALRGSHAGEAG